MAGGLNFLISLDEKISGKAQAATASLASLDAQLKKDSKELKILEAAMKRLSTQTNVSAERIKHLQMAIDKKKASVAKATNQIADMKDAVESSGGGVSKLSGLLGGAAGIYAAAAAAAVALVAVVYKVGQAMVSATLAAAGAYRNQRLNAEAMTGSAAAGKALVDATYDVASGVALAEDRVMAMGRSLQLAGLSGEAYKDTLRSLATVADIAGDEAANKIMELTKKAQAAGNFTFAGEALAGTGLTVNAVYAELATELGVGIDKIDGMMKAGKIKAETGIAAMNAAVKKRFGDVSARKMMDFDVQIMKAKESLTNMFKDVNIEPFLVAMQKLLSLFDTSTAGGRALKAVLEGAMNGFFAAATAALPSIKALLLGVIIASLRVYIAVKSVIAPLAKLFGLDASKTNSGLDTMVWLGQALLYTFVALGVTMAVSMLLALSPIILVGLAIYGLIRIVWSVVEGIAYLGGLVIDYFKNTSWGDLALDLVKGLAIGITGGTGILVAAVWKLGGSALSALKSSWDSHSPAKKFVAVGVTAPQGVVDGMEEGIPDVRRSIQHMVDIPKEMGLGEGSGRDAMPVQGLAPSMVIEAGAIQIMISGDGKDEKGIAAEVRSAIAEFFETMALRGGAEA